MANTAGKRKKNLQQDEDLLELKTFGNYSDPSEPKGNARRARWEPRYTSGTLHQKETGEYSSKSLEFFPDLDDPSIKPSMVQKPKGWEDTDTKRPSGRPIQHGIKTGTGSVHVSRGAKAPKGAQRGVGQPTIDGFINGLTGKSRRMGRRK